MRTRYYRKRVRRGAVGQAAGGAALIILLALAANFWLLPAAGDERIPLPLRLSLMHELPGFNYGGQGDMAEFAPPANGFEAAEGEDEGRDNSGAYEPVGYINFEGEGAGSENPVEISGQEVQPGELPIKEISLMASGTSGYLVAAEGVLVKNATSFEVDAKYLLGRPLPYNLTGKGAQVLIVHTHGSEAYTEPGITTYNPASDNNRSENIDENVVRVGAEMAAILEKAGIGVIHDKTMYDLEDFNRSYEAALEGIRRQLKENPSIKVVIDVHRDAMITAEGIKYKPVANIQGVDCAQIMLVMGTGQNGLSHEYWKENLKLALRLQNTMNTDYPGLARPIDLRKERFNQHATMGSMLVEVGSSGNTLEEALAGARCFTWALCKELNRIKK